MLEIDLGAVAYRAMWGYGVDPPSDTVNPHDVPFPGMLGRPPGRGLRPPPDDQQPF
jgi:hypothetical protein